jgi:hypothetical protein
MTQTRASSPAGLRAAHRRAVQEVKVALKPGDPKRHALLRRLDGVARTLARGEKQAMR